MLRDLRHAVRVLLKAKGWTLVVLTSLALGIGANTALFSAVNGLLIKPLPVNEPEHLVRLRWTGDNDAARNVMGLGYTGRGVSGSFSFQAFEALRDANQTLSGIFAGTGTPRVNLLIDGVAEVGSGFAASGEYFSVLRVPAVVGRVLGPADDEPGAEPVAVISYQFWQRRFGLDPGVIGRAIVVNDRSTTIVGVLPPSFTGIARVTDDAPDLHLPLAALHGPDDRDLLADPTFWSVPIMGRLAPGVTIEQVHGNLEGTLQATAQAALTNFLDELTPEERGRSRNQDLTAAPDLIVESAERGLYDASPRASRQASILGAVVGLVLLIVCANVATLLLSRATSRRREVAVRLAVGASRTRLVRQLVTESLLLSAVGGLLALPVAYTSRQLLPFGQDTPFDWRVFGFVAVISLTVGLVFSVGPALRATRVRMSGALSEHGRSVSPPRSLLSRGLVVAQVALSLVLLVSAGLFLKTVGALRNVDVGFNPENVLLFRIDPGQSGYERAEANRLADQIADRLREVPGVRSVTRSQLALLSGGSWTTTLWVPGEPEPFGSHAMTVSPTFFDTMEIPLLAGRTFGPQDTEEAPTVALLNQTAALELFGAVDVVGRRMGSSREEATEVEVIGVVADAKYRNQREAAPPTIFRSVEQSTPTAVTIAVRTTGAPGPLIPSVRDAVAAVAPRLPLMDVTTQSAELEERLGDERLYATAYSLFGGLATLLAAIGLFGLASYTVTQRTGEIGIRMALGAQRTAIARLVLRESLVLVIAGVVMGLAAVPLAGRLIESLLYGIAPTDPWTMVQAAILLVGTAALAVYLPGRRATGVDPMVALQDE